MGKVSILSYEIHIGDTIQVSTQTYLLTGILVQVRREFIQIVESTGATTYIPVEQIEFIRIMAPTP